MKLSALFRSVVFVSIFFSLLFTTSTETFAQSKTAQVATNAATSINSELPNNLHNWTQSVMLEVMSALSCQLTGIDPTTPNKQCLGFIQETGKIGFLPAANLEKGQIGGAIGGMNNMIAALYTPPLHTSDYFQNLAQNFGISKKTYAQNTGIGFDSLSPLMNMWTTFRNIVYLFLVVIFIVIGLAIMLRVKIDPRTVMTVQNQIPKIIVGILLVTFSFAIAGFLIDMMWVLIYLAYGAVSGTSGVDVQSLNPTLLQGKTALEGVEKIGGGIFGIPGTVAWATKDVLKNLIGVTGCENVGNCFNNLFNPLNFIIDPNDKIIPNLLYHLLSGAAGTAIYFKLASVSPGSTPIFSDIINFLKTVPGGLIAATATYAATEYLLRELLPVIIVYLIVFIALLVALFRLWFMLLKSYVMILIDVVLAPFWIIGGIIPGSQISFSGWLKDIGANLLAFPATIFMFLLGKVFMDSFGKSSTAGQSFVPPLIGNPGDLSLIGSLIGLGILFITPNIVNLIKQILKSPKMDTGLGKAIGAGTGITSVPGKLGQMGLMISGMSNVPLLKTLPGLREIANRSGTGGGGGKPSEG